MNVLFSQPYLRIERKIQACQQLHIENIEYINLYADRIITPSHTFQLNDVHDVSYKPFSTENGLLYLHTNQGVFTYYIEMTPSLFIDLYQSLK
ncbi:3-isopropylmalate dehydratase [Bacillus sp. DJP31]|uniref:3-isopropylmalate dehydratase n=1 Tax=Bacillus sp. DJP31 TaxID=3409789 RepID=UPI003BB77BC5